MDKAAKGAQIGVGIGAILGVAVWAGIKLLPKILKKK